MARPLEIRGFRAAILKTACVAVVAYWATIGGLAVVLAMYLIPSLDRALLNRSTLYLFLAFLAINLVGFAAGSQARCPSCRQMLLLNSWVTPHRAARRAPIIGYKLLVLDIFRRGHFVCYHCGSTIHCARTSVGLDRRTH